MSDKEYIHSLIAYLQVLAEVQKSGDFKVFAEIKRTIEKLEILLRLKRSE